ncbi:MAG: hypothetical protein GY870_06440 [archaeon]|nr:hypothetical protein [archaeon]
MENLFLTEQDLSPWDLKLTEENPKNNLKVWTNTTQGVLVQRVVEVLWQFKSPEKALTFHLEYLHDNAENSPEISIESIEPFGQELRAFVKGPEDKLLSAFNLSMNMYFFLFCEGKILVKSFISGTDELSIEEAAKFARLAHKKIVNS